MTDDPPPVRPLAVPARRLSRARRIGGLAGGLLGNIAWNGAAELSRGRRPRFNDLLMTPGNMRRVADELAHMRGAAMKLGQLISMDAGDVMPKELADVFARLRADAHFMPPAQLKKVLDANWPKGWIQQFEPFDTRPIAAASIGQVHRVRTREGRDLAVKVQYPGVADSIESDVANLGLLVRASGLLPKSFDLAPYLEEARAQLRDETDYDREARALVRFAQLLDGESAFAVPELAAEWSGPSILAMSFMDSVPVEDAQTAPQEERDRIARRLVSLTLRELFEFGVMQTDPNYANYRYQPETGRIVLLDFGATMDIAPEITALYRRLLRAGLRDDSDALEAAASGLGLLSPDMAERHRAKLLSMIEEVMRSVRETDMYECADPSLPQRLQAEGMALAEDGLAPPQVPMQVLFIQRKLGGIYSLAARLRARVPIRSLLEAWV
ncbi:AarF/ABC1/UbiB kinase family protein [Maritimibacter sp. DP07]|uniref:AarF/ABC1/UbiB kinase family protein n=1 Tax=Maritimibacter harenae TaxID=2606218 RepID=A0A845M3F9_9RHOB|nr:AarF/ABC1/UbiB kinase family protein [Maritimibacter harenae]MZR12908.1 AarF/ABC1/UbiB kinase family protein [Maritimibacter harenae]